MKGTKLGTYIIEDKLGEGGMGVVYTATDTQLKRKAVIKMLHKHLAKNKAVAKRFENEALAAAGIRHPGIVEIYGIGHAADGALYIAMELMGGESLQDRISREGRIPVGQAVSFIRQAAGALAAAHAGGIIHRDLKPDNMFITPDAEVAGGRLKLLDFGIAKLTGDGPKSVATKTGALMGTPDYMSPEQCKGAGHVDYRSDLYSLGCILFQLVTGRTPFIKEGAGEYIIAHVIEVPPKLREFKPGAPEALEELVSKLLLKDPDERFGPAAALATELREIAGTLTTTKVEASSVPLTAIAAVTPVAIAVGKGKDDKKEPPKTTLSVGAGESEYAEAERKKSGAVFATIALVMVGVLALGGYKLFGGTSERDTTVVSSETVRPTDAQAPREVALILDATNAVAPDAHEQIAKNTVAQGESLATTSESESLRRELEPGAPAEISKAVKGTDRPAKEPSSGLKPASRVRERRGTQPRGSEAKKVEAFASLSREQVVEGFAAVRTKVASCGANHDLQGTTKPKIKISLEGAVTSVTFARGSDKFKRCAEKALAKARFPVSAKGVTATFPFPLPEKLSDKETAWGVHKISSRLLACREDYQTKNAVNIDFIIGRTGKVLDVRINSPVVGFSKCLKRGARAARFKVTPHGATARYRLR